MPGVVLPPFGSPAGPELSRDQLIDAYLGGARTGFSEDLHIENDMLLAERMVPFGVRLGPDCLLIRGDIPPETMGLKEAVEGMLASHGLSPVEPDTRLGDIAAIQVTGVRGGVWDLWGAAPGEAHQKLEAAAVGGDAGALQIALEGTGSNGRSTGDFGVGMTLEELLEEDLDDSD